MASFSFSYCFALYMKENLRLILQPVTLLNLFIKPNRFFYIICIFMLSPNIYHFVFAFQSLAFLFISSYLTVLRPPVEGCKLYTIIPYPRQKFFSILLTIQWAFARIRHPKTQWVKVTIVYYFSPICGLDGWFLCCFCVGWLMCCLANSF